jgi:hypothetical protein
VPGEGREREVVVPRRCTICTHPQREEIDRALASGQPFRTIAVRYGVSATSLKRHRAHVQDAIQQAIEAKVVSVGASVLDRIRELNREARSLLEEARSRGRYAAAVQAISAATRLWLPDLVQSPQEVWLVPLQHERRVVFRQRYLKVYREGRDRHLILSAEVHRGVMVALTFIETRNYAYLQNQRAGFLRWP